MRTYYKWLGVNREENSWRLMSSLVLSNNPTDVCIVSQFPKKCPPRTQSSLYMLQFERALQEGVRILRLQTSLIHPSGVTRSKSHPILTPGLLSATNSVNLSPMAPSMIKIRPSQPTRKQRRPSWGSEKWDMAMDHWKGCNYPNRNTDSN